MNKTEATAFEEFNEREPQDFVTYSLSRLQAKLNAQASAVLRSYSGLSLVQWRILVVLRVMGADSLTSICRVSDMDKGQVSRKLNRLIEDGLVISTPRSVGSPDIPDCALRGGQQGV